MNEAVKLRVFRGGLICILRSWLKVLATQTYHLRRHHATNVMSMGSSEHKGKNVKIIDKKTTYQIS